MTETREGHLEWCKQRAIEYCDRNDLNNAFNSFVSDMDKDPQTARHSGLELFSLMFYEGRLSDPSEMKRFIEGFN